MKTLSLLFSLILIGSLLAYPIQAQEEALKPPAEEVAAEPSGEMEEEMDVEAMPEEEVILMNSEWATLTCEAWNGNSTLTEGLAAPGWVANNKDRGYKVLQVYRTDCDASPWVELHIADQDGKALCTYGGPVKTEELVAGVDYIMHAQTQRWLEMGAGNYGPMKGMMTGRLKFKGPKWEAMKNMGPFTSFLQLTGEVPSDSSICPAEAGEVDSPM